LEGEKKKHTEEEAETEAVGEARQIEEPRAPLASIAQAAMTAVPPVGCVGKTTDRCNKTLSPKHKTQKTQIEREPGRARENKRARTPHMQTPFTPKTLS
jgi:hypothetical protein